MLRRLLTAYNWHGSVYWRSSLGTGVAVKRLPGGPEVTKLLVPILRIQQDVDLMNDIAATGARGFQLVNWMKQAEEQNRDLLDGLSRQLD